MFTGLNRSLCEAAYQFYLEPMIESGSRGGLFNKHAGCLVVLDPRVPYEPKYRDLLLDDASMTTRFDEIVLWQTDVDPHHAKADVYQKVARAKAFLSWKTSLPAKRVQQEAPYLFEPEMTKWGGSAVGPGGLVVAFSGVQEYFDQMISEMMISAIKAVCLSEMADVMADEETVFFPLVQRR